jgi:Uncharacterized conserved protein
METTTNTAPLVKEILLDATPERVWSAITDPEEMKKWYFTMVDFKPEVGNSFSFTGCDDEEEFTHICKISDVVPGKTLRHSWTYKGYPGESFVTWELIPEGNKTLLRLTHEGLHTFPSAEKKSFARESFQAGWDAIIGELLPAYIQKTV